MVAEGASLFAQDITLIADGNTALEHNIPQMALYEDVVSFFAQTKVAYTPTLVVTYGGLAGDPYWRSQPMSGVIRSCRRMCRRISCSRTACGARRRRKRTSSTASRPRRRTS